MPKNEIAELVRDFFSNLAASHVQENIQIANETINITSLEGNSFLQNDQILDMEFSIEEIELSLRTLKLGKSKGAYGLMSEHLLYGGRPICLWLKRIFDAIISNEVIPACLKAGVVVPVYKGKGKDPLIPNSYRGITMSSVIAKTLEIVLLKRMSPILDEIGFPDMNQTAFQKGISCSDAIFSTQEVLVNYIRQGNNPFLCLYDIEKAFDSVEFPILLCHLYSLGINGKTWRIIKSWYSSPTSRVKHQNVFSAPFPINRGVKQGSVLSPSLFLIVMNSLLKKMRNSNNGGSLHGTFVGIAIHADDVRSIAPNIQSVISQSSDILSFTTDLGLKLNTSKLELIQMS